MKYFSNKGYNCFAPEMRGYGETTGPNDVSRYSVLELASDVNAVIENLCKTPAIIIGHDWGAPIVHATAIGFKQNVKAVVQMSVPPFGSQNVYTWDTQYTPENDLWFYQNYMVFRTEEAIAEFNAITRPFLKTMLVGASGDGPGWPMGIPGYNKTFIQATHIN